MLTRVYIKWEPLLVSYLQWNWNTFSFAAGFVVAFAVTAVFVKQTGSTRISLVATGSRINQNRFLKLLLARC